MSPGLTGFLPSAPFMSDLILFATHAASVSSAERSGSASSDESSSCCGALSLSKKAK